MTKENKKKKKNSLLKSLNKRTQNVHDERMIGRKKFSTKNVDFFPLGCNR